MRLTKKYYLLFLLFAFLAMVSKAQFVTNPVLPIANKALTITFSSAEESRLGYFTGDLYAHTGVGIKGGDNWQHVIGDWGQNNIQPQLTYLGDGVYEIQIVPDINSFYSVTETDTIINISMVIRSGDGSAQTDDIFIDVYQPGLDIGIQAPKNQAIFSMQTAYAFKAVATENALLTFKVNETIVAQNQGETIETDYAFHEAGDYTIVAIAETDEELVSDTSKVYVRSEVPVSTLPLNAKKGISYIDDTTVRLVLWAPEKEFVFLLSELSNWIPNNNFMLNKDGDYFWIELNDLVAGKEYAFQYYIDGEVKIADPYADKISDPWNDVHIPEATYSNLLQYPNGKTDGIASVFQTAQEAYVWTSPDVEMPANEEMVIYELLVRDFTEEHTFKAVRERLDYLQDLRINVLELMPVNEFEGNSSWGYNPSFYFAVDKYYGHKNELKKLIDECHQRGIAVVIDMVLNHSYSLSPLVKMYSNGSVVTADNPWYNVSSNFQNPDAQWGYDFNHESEATKEFVDSVNSYWINEYNVDGFRFDFTKGFSNTIYPPSSWGSDYDADRIANLKRMSDEIWKQNPEALVICEHLSDNKEEKELAEYGLMLWGNMSYNYGEAAMAYTENSKSDLSWGYYAERGWTEPNLVTYQESHDEERLAYKCQLWGNAAGSYDITNIERTLDRIELTSAFHLPLPGPKMIWQFGELGYDISIDQNGRVGEKPIRWDYFERANRKDLFRVMASLNFLKQNYEEFSTNEIEYSLKTDIKSYVLSKNNEHVVVLGNFNVEEKTVLFTFPKTGTWYNYFDQEEFEVSTADMEIVLKPGEYLLLSTREFETPSYTTKVGIDAIESSSSIDVYPNPTTGQLFINSKEKNFEIEFYNASGRRCLQIKNQKNISIESLERGIYHYRVKTSNTVYNGQVLKL
jgi:1,4-alpha-glucan branching enzyme